MRERIEEEEDEEEKEVKRERNAEYQEEAKNSVTPEFEEHHIHIKQEPEPEHQDAPRPVQHQRRATPANLVGEPNKLALLIDIRDMLNNDSRSRKYSTDQASFQQSQTEKDDLQIALKLVRESLGGYITARGMAILSGIMGEDSVFVVRYLAIGEDDDAGSLEYRYWVVREMLDKKAGGDAVKGGLMIALKAVSLHFLYRWCFTASGRLVLTDKITKDTQQWIFAGGHSPNY